MIRAQKYIVLSVLACSLMACSDDSNGSRKCSCSEGQVCGGNGICYDDASCAKCGEKQVCVSGTCYDADSECGKCGPTDICEDGSCKTEDKCEDGKCETEDKCKDGSCKTEDKCEDGKCETEDKCEDGNCEDQECDEDNENCSDVVCPSGSKEGSSCLSDYDCCSDSRCVKNRCDGTSAGVCTREDRIDHCVDNDNDGFYTVTNEAYINECEFSEKNARDLDDCNPLVYPGAPEICDGVDNDGDGCIDGTINDKGECRTIVKPCWGAGSVENYDNSVCSAALIGAEACFEGELVFARPDDHGYYIVDPTGACPTSTAQIPDYDDESADDSTTRCDGIDNNCNGIVDEQCKSE